MDWGCEKEVYVAPWAGTFTPIVGDQENLRLSTIVNYPNEVPGDRLQLLTRYLGDTPHILTTGDGTTKLTIDTKELLRQGLYYPIEDGGPHVWLAENFAKEILPWNDCNQDLVLQVYASVPQATQTDINGLTGFNFSADRAPVTQVSFGIYLEDKSSGKGLVYIVPFYESRGHYIESVVAERVSSPLEGTSRLITKSMYSESLQATPFSDRRFFRIHLTANNLREAILESKTGLSNDLSQYKLLMAGVLFEMPNYVYGASNVSSVNLTLFSAYTFKHDVKPIKFPPYVN
jgi:hypothetical protein